MRRRTALASLGAMILGTRVVGAAERCSSPAGLQRETGEAAARVILQARQLPQSGQVVRLCRLLADQARHSSSLSPALVQATLDACWRKMPQRRANGLAGFRQSVADFERSARRFIEAAAA